MEPHRARWALPVKGLWPFKRQPRRRRTDGSGVPEGRRRGALPRPRGRPAHPHPRRPHCQGRHPCGPPRLPGRRVHAGSLPPFPTFSDPFLPSQTLFYLPLSRTHTTILAVSHGNVRDLCQLQPSNSQTSTSRPNSLIAARGRHGRGGNWRSSHSAALVITVCQQEVYSPKSIPLVCDCACFKHLGWLAARKPSFPEDLFGLPARDAAF